MAQLMSPLLQELWKLLVMWQALRTADKKIANVILYTIQI